MTSKTWPRLQGVQGSASGLGSRARGRELKGTGGRWTLSLWPSRWRILMITLAIRRVLPDHLTSQANSFTALRLWVLSCFDVLFSDLKDKKNDEIIIRDFPFMLC
ncbi:hypothetical protein [Deinococcus sp. AJ005]|uniref:hypothetical protein n=1 Tax=Deinococcus sp. AJ005 TaxID=2652443 RepID=UPI00125CD3AE|nr:hypothetical protein [Deinococcus sp. AJ005]QFP75017.1 hypothetical protein DAAJ005_00175 [Deinococcus sp. AJ005]